MWSLNGAVNKPGLLYGLEQHVHDETQDLYTSFLPDCPPILFYSAFTHIYPYIYTYINIRFFIYEGHIYHYCSMI